MGAALDLGDAAEAADETALSGVMQLYADLQRLGAPSANTASAGGYGTQTGALVPDCIQQTGAGGSITDQDCQVASATFNGTISRTGDVVDVDLTIDLDPSAAAAGTSAAGVVESLTVTEKGQLTVKASHLGGDLHVTADTTVNPGAVSGLPEGVPVPSSNSITSTLEASFDVSLDAGCAVGGTLTLVSKTAGVGGNQTVTQTATFGPSCGDVSVE